MRDYYGKWWSGVESRLSDFEPISLGCPQEDSVSLSSSDWEDLYCDNNKHVGEATGGPQGGVWSILVERSGRYEIELRRWPFHTDASLTSMGPQKTVSGRPITTNQVVPIAAAKLQIAGQLHQSQTARDARGVVFQVTLETGRTTMQAWFQDSAGKDLCGVFYAHVRRVRP